ncbi:MAG TPA: hypothetical protein PLW44_18220, partial [Chitinophagales bacterium]|nr:hypothetical protein [Chitinophagales bacterium]
MRLKHSLCLGMVLLLFTAKLWAQSVTDTIPYKITYYEVKKTQTVAELAKSLKVNPVTIVKLNRFKNDAQQLGKGRRLKVPVYPKGVVYPPVPPKAEKKPTGNKAEEKKP